MKVHVNFYHCIAVIKMDIKSTSSLYLPSQNIMSHTRRTDAQGNVREKRHMNHSVM